MTLSEIRKKARESLSGKWKIAALLTFVFYLVTFGISIIYAILSYVPFINLVAMVGFYTIYFPIMFGLIFCFMEIKKGNNIDCGDFLTIGFSNFKRIWCIIGNIFKKIWLYLLLYFILPFVIFIPIGFLIGFSIAMEAPFLIIFGCLFLFVFLAAYIAIAILFVTKIYLYILTPYIAWDNPDMSAKEVVDRSEELMKGYRGKYFLLELSFIGWGILSVFTLGIGLLWLLPYIQIACIIYYEHRFKKTNITSNIEENINEPKKVEESKSEENITEVKEENIEKIDILDDEGNIIN